MNRSELKEDAKAKLKGKYTDIITMFIIVAVITAVATCAGTWIDQTLGLIHEEVINFGYFEIPYKTTGLFSTLFAFIITGVIGFGLVEYFLNISRGKEVNWKDIFNRKDMFVFYIILSLLVSLFACLWSLLFIIPGIIAAISYSLVFYLKLDNPDLEYMDLIRKSKELMKGHKWEFFVLNLSFIGWALLVPFTLGILAFWLVPYIAVTECNFYNKLIKK